MRHKKNTPWREVAELKVSSTVTGCYMIARATDGTLWQYNWQKADWEKLPDLPQTP